MKNKLFFNQKKALTVRILGVVILVLLAYLWFNVSLPISQIVVMFSLGIFLVGYSVAYEFNNDFKNKKHLKLFGVTLFKVSLDVLFPEYISVFSASFKKGADWGSVAAIGKENKENDYVIRLFKGRKHFTVYKTKSQEEARDKATALATLLKVELVLKV